MLYSHRIWLQWVSRSEVTARWDGTVPVANSTTPAVDGNAMHRSECQAGKMSSGV